MRRGYMLSVDRRTGYCNFLDAHVTIRRDERTMATTTAAEAVEMMARMKSPPNHHEKDDAGKVLQLRIRSATAYLVISMKPR